MNSDTSRESVTLMKTTSVSVSQQETGAGVSRVESTKKRNRRRPNHWVILDSAWANLLGVRKAAGVYQIRSNELQLKLFLLQQASSLQRCDADRPGVNNDDDRRPNTLLKPQNSVTATGQSGRASVDSLRMPIRRPWSTRSCAFCRHTSYRGAGRPWAISCRGQGGG